jgi:hypothetical protein
MAMPAENGSKVTVRVDELLRERLEAEAQAERRPVAAMAKLLIADALAVRQEVKAMAQSTMSLHKDAVTAAEQIRQAVLATPGVTQAQAKAADIAFHQAVVTSAMANSVSPSVSLQALRSLGAGPPPLPSVVPHLDVTQLPPILPPAPAKPPPDPEPKAAADQPAAVDHAEAKPSGAVPPGPPRRPPGR